MELCLLVVAYRKAGPKLVLVAGALTGFAEAIYERISYYPMFRFGDTIVYFVFMIVSGALLGGLVAWGIVRGLAAAGALSPSQFLVNCVAGSHPGAQSHRETCHD
ncbi:substrate-specific component YkoE of thiamin-regulated ECF transporter [Cutibacterium acnes JCM 18918]|nr:substrate-specific component YkoE of thiamin-regulated ECF transporter [Cutibacterium acnes JCM 18918]